MTDPPIVEKIKDHLQSITDLTLLVLKAHLLVEEQINWVLNEIFPNGDALDGARLSFHQRVKLLQAINKDELTARVLGFAERLNRLRNTLAHQLEPPGLDGQVEKFVADVAASVPVRLFNVTAHANLHVAMCIGYMCGVLHRFRDAVMMTQEAPPEVASEGGSARHE
jgi:hypothetical protein